MTLSLTASRGFALILSPPPTPPPLLPLQSCVRFAALFIGLSPMDWTGTLADDTRFGWTPVSSDPLETLASEVSQQGLTGTSNGRWFLKDKQTGEHSIGLAPRQNGTTAWLRQQPEREVGVDRGAVGGGGGDEAVDGGVGHPLGVVRGVGVGAVVELGLELGDAWSGGDVARHKTSKEQAVRHE